MEDPHDGASILIVDDSPGNRMTFKAVLEPLGYHIDLAASGTEGVGLAARREYSVILLDVRMPIMNGFEAAEAIRQKGKSQHSPIIFVSGYDYAPMHVEKGYRAGATDYLVSPVDEGVLKHKVAAFVNISKRNHALKQQIRALNELLTTLQKDVQACKPEQEALSQRVAELERAMSKLTEELSTFPSAA